MEAPTLTPEQQEERERLETIGLDGQTREFREAVKSALTVVNHELVANGGEPQIDAVTAALISVLAEFIAMQPSRSVRRLQISHCDRDLKRMVALRTSSIMMGVRPQP